MCCLMIEDFFVGENNNKLIQPKLKPGSAEVWSDAHTMQLSQLWY